MDEHRRLAHVVGRDADMGAHERPQSVHRIGGRRRGGRRSAFEPGCDPIDDRPQELFLRGDVRVQAWAADVERARDVADARRRVAVPAEQVAGRILDGATPWCLDHNSPN